MKKGPFSAEWLAQSSRGGARPSAAGGRQSPTELGESEVSGTCTRGRRLRHRPLPSRSRRNSDCRDSVCRSIPGHEAETGVGASATPGRPRTKFAAAQLQELERSFREQRYIGATEKRRLAAALSLSHSQVKTWFQNRRMKFKRQTQDDRVEALFSGLFLPYHSFSDIDSSSYSQGMDINVSSTSTISLHPAMPSPALLFCSSSVLSDSFAKSSSTVASQPRVISLLFCNSSNDSNHWLKDLRFQPYLLPIRNAKDYL